MRANAEDQHPPTAQVSEHPAVCGSHSSLSGPIIRVEKAFGVFAMSQAELVVSLIGGCYRFPASGNQKYSQLAIGR